MQDIRHQSLKPHVFDTGDHLGPLEVFAGHVCASFPSIVHEILSHFSKSTTFFAEVDDDPTAAVLRFFDGLLDAKNEVWSTCTDVGAEDWKGQLGGINEKLQALTVTTIALIVDS